ncbi:MAG TPA: ribulose-phosphate 3-epimerase [Clostridiales bacterium]|nr:ribulose-phosphate 3-epimerase [Clostridiales bacterium]
MQIAPSLLSCDFAKMGEEIVRMDKAGADYMHLDVMDGNFVPNISFGAPIIKAVRKHTSVPFDVHLMIDKPFDYIDDFVGAGADIITFHVESSSDIRATIDKIKAANVKAGLVIKPNTPAEAVFPYLDDIYMVLIMTVEPGFGGQSFMADMMPKVRCIKDEAQNRGLKILIEADGGINEATILQTAQAGVDIAVSGTGVFKAPDPKQAIDNLKALSKGAV